jgi:hypothetical protein
MRDFEKNQFQMKLIVLRYWFWLSSQIVMVWTQLKNKVVVYVFDWRIIRLLQVEEGSYALLRQITREGYTLIYLTSINCLVLLFLYHQDVVSIWSYLKSWIPLVCFLLSFYSTQLSLKSWNSSEWAWQKYFS